MREPRGPDSRLWKLVTAALAAIVLVAVVDFAANSIGDEETMRRVGRMLDMVRDAQDCPCPE